MYFKSLIFGALSIAVMLFIAVIISRPQSMRFLSQDDLITNQLRRELTQNAFDNEFKCLRVCSSDFCSVIIERVIETDSNEIADWYTQGYYSNNNALVILLGIRKFVDQQAFRFAIKACHRRNYHD